MSEPNKQAPIMQEQFNKCTVNGWVGGCMGGWMDGWMHGCMDAWMHG
jgi:hypothetical protein